MIDQAAAYLEACLSSAQCKMNESLADLAWELKRAKHQSLIHVQLCALLSQLNDHAQGLTKAKQAVRLARFSLEATAQAYQLQSVKLQLYKRKRVPVPEKVMQSHILAERAYPTLHWIQTFLATGSIEEDPEMRSVLGVKTFSDWVYSLSISEIMAIQPLTLEEVKAKPQLRAEFAKDAMLRKAAQLAVSFFCVSTELKFLRGKQAFNPERDHEG
jgi:hypothetical protein